MDSHGQGKAGDTTTGVSINTCTHLCTTLRAKGSLSTGNSNSSCHPTARFIFFFLLAAFFMLYVPQISSVNSKRARQTEMSCCADMRVVTHSSCLRVLKCMKCTCILNLHTKVQLSSINTHPRVHGGTQTLRDSIIKISEINFAERLEEGFCDAGLTILLI